MDGLNAKTLRIIESMFPPEQREDVRQFLVAECGNNLPGFGSSDEEEIERLHCAALKLSKGHLDELLLVIEEIQEDWRDILMAAHFASSPTDHTAWADNYLSTANQLLPTDNEPIEAAVYQLNWVKCPQCGWRFCLKNTSSWSGERHRRCGQRLRLIDNE